MRARDSFMRDHGHWVMHVVRISQLEPAEYATCVKRLSCMIDSQISDFSGDDNDLFRSSIGRMNIAILGSIYLVIYLPPYMFAE